MLPNILLSNASLVTKSCIARFVDDDAFNASALSDCSTGPSPPLAHAKSSWSPSQTNAGCPQPGLFSRFRSISEQTVYRGRKIRAQCERPPIRLFKTQVSCPSAQYLQMRAFVNTLSFFCLCQAVQCRRLYSTLATNAPVLMADRSGRPSSPFPPRPPTPTERGPRRRDSGLNSYNCLATFPTAETLWEAKTANSYKCTQKWIISTAPKNTKPQF